MNTVARVRLVWIRTLGGFAGECPPLPGGRALRRDLSGVVGLVLTLLSLGLGGAPAAGQAPPVQWTRADWFPTHPVTGAQTAASSGEDWWYDHKNSYAGAVINGYICAGYSTFVNWAPSEGAAGGCFDAVLGDAECGHLETRGNVRGTGRATLALLSTTGTGQLWFESYNEGWFYRVIQTSDGGYLAIGRTLSTRTQAGLPLAYNPDQTPGSVTDAFGAGSACSLGDNVAHTVLVKTDSVGVVEWQSLYGMTPYRDGSSVPQPAVAYAASSEGFDVLETPEGHFRFVGRAQEDSQTYSCGGEQPLLRAFMIEVDADGLWLFGTFLGDPTVPGSATAITRYGSGPSERYVVAGTEYFWGDSINPFTGCWYFQKAWVSQFGAASSQTPLWTTTDFDFAAEGSQSRSQSSFDVAISVRAGVDEILAPMIVDCSGCLYASNNAGQARVFRLNTSGQILDDYDLGPVNAFDLKLRVSPTEDGGFGFVSTHHATAPPAPYECYDTGYWNTDAYVGKCNACGQVEWARTFDFDAVPSSPYPGDLKQQECLYSISQASDGGFVVSGNNSYNFDDDFLGKLLPGTPVTADLWVGDTPQDLGIEPNPDGGPMWVSEDIWIRNQDDSGQLHQNPEYSATIPVFIKVRVRNKGCEPASGELKLYWAKASTGLAWPDQWDAYSVGSLLLGDQVPSAPLLIASLAAGAELTFSVAWFVPNPEDYTSFGAEKAHFCLLARIESSPVAPFGMTSAEGANVYENARNNNGIAWKNLTVVDDLAYGKTDDVVLVRNTWGFPALTQLEFNAGGDSQGQASSFLAYGGVEVDLGAALFQTWVEGGMVGEGFVVSAARVVNDGTVAAGGAVGVASAPVPASLSPGPIGSSGALPSVTPSLRLLGAHAVLGNLVLGPGETHAIRIRATLSQAVPAGLVASFPLDVVQQELSAGEPQIQGGQRFLFQVGSTIWTDQGCALPGISGPPLATGSGPLSAGSSNQLELANAAPNAPAALLLGLASAPMPYMGGTLKPFPISQVLGVVTDGLGAGVVPFSVVAGTPPGTELWVQWVVQDVAAIQGEALSNALLGVTQ